jgi:hypothetical protein
MSDLSQLQDNFQNYLLQNHSSIQLNIISTEKISAGQRLDIYRDAYSLRLIELLTTEYPVLLQLLGDEDFDILARNFIAAQPSTFKSVRWYGVALPAFIEATGTDNTHPILAEMARFENAISESFDASNCEPVSFEAVAAIPFAQWPAMRFNLQAAFRRLDAHWNVLPVWNAIGSDETPTLEHTNEINYLMIWRKHLEVQFCTLTIDEAYVIDAMQSEKTFSEICEGLCEWVTEEQVAMHAATLLKRFINDEIITAIII